MLGRACRTVDPDLQCVRRGDLQLSCSLPWRQTLTRGFSIMAAPGVTQAPGGLDGLARSEEVREYEKILKISDEIFSGTHLRLKVPQQFVSKSASRNTSGLSNTQQTQGARTGGSAGSSVERLSQSTPSGLHNSTSNSLADMCGVG